MEAAPGPALHASLVRIGLMEPDESPRYEPLTGGVSSDIWRVDLRRGPICVKRALARLRVAADWRAPVERNAYEAEWLARVGMLLPGAAPALLGHDTAAGLLAMEWLDPRTHPVWKERLRRGDARPDVAAELAHRLVRIHASTADDPDVAAAFPTDAIFREIRLEPYLLATARVHPDLAGPLEALAATTAVTRRCLVHGDVSPKNVLVGPRGPMLLDAECAWYGDPAFDLAFCLNHLLLKCLWTPSAASGFLACFSAFGAAYRAGVAWEPADDVEGRAARLLPGLLLARVDGKSPVEYVTAEADKARVRRVAARLLRTPPADLAVVAGAWSEEMTA